MRLSTDAIVLHVFDYSETSRIVRLATRDAGVQSALARGARRPRSKFGSALDLFAHGVAELHLKEGRDLQTLSAFEVTDARAPLGLELERFASASALAELVLRFGAAEDAQPGLFDALAGALDAVSAASARQATEAGLAGAWRLVSELGFAPALSHCSSCHTPVPTGAELSFNHAAGGVLCASCARAHPGGRRLPAPERACVDAWSRATRVSDLEPRSARAHQRLLHEFLQQHLADGRALRAFDAWESGGWAAP
ncbi:MAG TPA: DNA repair protein RecO [Gemmatimonadaceae bacterium]|nr:DNA repair protein RecO [Gemmatimonadaceae bacterium]